MRNNAINILIRKNSNLRGKMRKSVIVLIGILTLQCLSYGKIKVLKDDFKNQTTFTLDMYAYTNSISRGAKTLFVMLTKTVVEGSEPVIKLYLFSKFTDHDLPLSTLAFFKLDDKKIKIELQNPKSSLEGYRFSSWNSYSAEVVLTKELQNNLLNANSLSIRFYSGEFPYDADFSPSDLLAIKELIKRKL
ncbi:hypothetical protein [Leptospira licerasiae]|uniref:Uncharacterized protein n=1 Tax=Leptospira licerasiae str. MMD4847 TaxID=1049971 RepID=A0ABN0HE49_9LEPT|nr:hypothetical protein [Leptospira licerasiae]EIE03404.1 hypothetical protein LEP1GSC185_3551 [Leptospira licerasiae serovar Varillal str. VAR 010]EJZ44069.1 hypothetical protein LEP1GSC178_2343 [Leptospira licerasiae str. MMD4847]